MHVQFGESKKIRFIILLVHISVPGKRTIPPSLWAEEIFSSSMSHLLKILRTGSSETEIWITLSWFSQLLQAQTPPLPLGGCRGSWQSSFFPFLAEQIYPFSTLLLTCKLLIQKFLPKSIFILLSFTSPHVWFGLTFSRTFIVLECQLKTYSTHVLLVKSHLVTSQNVTSSL